MTGSETTILALDAHGGDQGLAAFVPAALAALGQDQRLEIVLVGDRPGLQSALAAAGVQEDRRLRVQHAGSVIPMDAKPAAVLRHGRGSSLWTAFELVAAGEAAACVSGGNTAAMMVVGMKLLGKLPGIQRPALMGYVPNLLGYTGMLDLGANLSVSSRQFV